MEPQIIAAIGAGIASGMAGVEGIRRLLPSKGINGKMEACLERLVELAEQDRARGTDLVKALALMQQEMCSHEARESKAWEDMFRIVRQLRNGR